MLPLKCSVELNPCVCLWVCTKYSLHREAFQTKFFTSRDNENKCRNACFSVSWVVESVSF